MPLLSTIENRCKHDLDVWITQEGKRIAFKDLDTSHLLNIVALLYRGWENNNPQRNKLISLEKELVRRLNVW